MHEPAELRIKHRTLFRTILSENGLEASEPEDHQYLIAFYLWYTDAKNRERENEILAYTSDKSLAKTVQHEFRLRQVENTAQAYASVIISQRMARTGTFVKRQKAEVR